MYTSHQIHQALKTCSARDMPCHNGVIVASFDNSDDMSDFKQWFDKQVDIGWSANYGGLEIELRANWREF